MALLLWYNDYGYINTINFVVDLLERSVAPEAQVSALAFSFNTDFLYSFDWPQSSDRSDIVSVLEAEKKNYAKSTTDTFNALLDGIEDFETSANVLQTDNNLMILITDGQPYCSKWDFDCEANVCDQLDLLNRLDSYNVRIIMIGISSGFISDSLDCLCSPDDIYEFDDFSLGTFQDIEDAMRPILCPATPALIEWESSVDVTGKRKHNKKSQKSQNNNDNSM